MLLTVWKACWRCCSCLGCWCCWCKFEHPIQQQQTSAAGAGITPSCCWCIPCYCCCCCSRQGCWRDSRHGIWSCDAPVLVLVRYLEPSVIRGCIGNGAHGARALPAAEAGVLRLPA
jgi:hypothetical protein